MKKDERYRPICMRLLKNKHFIDFEKIPIEELTAIIEFITLLKSSRREGYNSITLCEINELFEVEK